MERMDWMHAELRRLRRENRLLRQRLRGVEREPSQRDTTERDAARRLAAQALHRYRLFAKPSYARYLWADIRTTGIYRRTLLVLTRFRQYRIISRILTVLATMFAAMGTGAAMLVITLLCLLLIPAALLPLGGTTLLGLFRRRAQDAHLRPLLAGRTVYLYFPLRIRTPSYAHGMLRALALRPHSAVFVISPYVWATHGFGGRGFYINARDEGEGLFLLRRHYYFSFRRMLGEQTVQRIVVIL